MSVVEERKSKKEKVPFVFADFHLIYELIRDSPNLRENCLEVEIKGYDLYLVEQWSLEREPTNLVVSYTGDPAMVVKCCKMYLPLNPSKWPLILQRYYKFIENFRKLKYIKDIGYFFVCDIHDFNFDYQNLNLIPVLQGDIRQVWHNFTNNTNLRRLHCGGRSSVMLKTPSVAALDKFYQLYKIVRKINLKPSLNENKPVYSVVELVIYLVQISLNFCNLLETKFVDGFYCHKTERALHKWQKTYGVIYFPSLIQQTKTLTPSLLSAILSLLLVCFYKFKLENCLQQYSCVPDPFIEPNLIYVAIYHFQKKLKMKKIKHIESSCLDIPLIDKLFEVTDESDSNEFSNLKKIVKTTMKDISVSAGLSGIGVSYGAGSAMVNLASTNVMTNNLDDFVKTINSYSTIFNNVLNVDFSELLEKNFLLGGGKNKDKDSKQPNDANEYNVQKGSGGKSDLNLNTARNGSSTSMGSKHGPNSIGRGGKTSSNNSGSNIADISSKLNGKMLMKMHNYKGSLLGWLWNESNKNTEESFFYNDFIWFNYSKSFNKDFDHRYEIESKNEFTSFLQESSSAENLNVKSDQEDQDDQEDADGKFEQLKIKEFYYALEPQKYRLDQIAKESEKKSQTLKHSDSNNDGDGGDSVTSSQASSSCQDKADKILYDPSFVKELKRSKSMSDFSLVKPSSLLKTSCLLKRVHSFSNVQEYFEDFERPLNAIKFAFDLKTLESFNCQSYINDDAELPENLTFLKSTTLPYISLNHGILKDQFETELETKMSTALKQKKQLESVISKYNYDIRLLERRMRNVADALEQFEMKSNTMKKQLLEAAKTRGTIYLEELRDHGLLTDEEMNSLFFNSEQDRVSASINSLTNKYNINLPFSEKINNQSMKASIKTIRVQENGHFNGFIVLFIRLMIVALKVSFFKIRGDKPKEVTDKDQHTDKDHDKQDSEKMKSE